MSGHHVPIDPDLFDPKSGRAPLSPVRLTATQRWSWYEVVWEHVVMLQDRYELQVPTGWWRQPPVVEVLAALAAWVERYDSGEWDDPPGKLALLYEIDRVQAFLGHHAPPDRFDPTRDRPDFHHDLATRLHDQPPEPAGS